MQKEYVDFLVIGGGVAGLRAAIELAPHGEVLVVTKDIPTESSSEYAQGGVAVALSDEDRVGIHYRDTIRAGAGLSDEEAVRILVEEGPGRIQELISWGAEFDREGTKLAFTLEAAHSRKRVLHAHGDATGRELVRVLIGKASTFSTVRRYPFAMLVDLVVSRGVCLGAYVLRDRKVRAVLARATVLATGGGGQIYSITTNPPVATADGMAAAHRAGAEMKHMEFVQFHPSTRTSHVYLDLRHHDAGFVKERFPRIYSTCLTYDVDITGDLIPVSPAAHYMMGGVRTDTQGATTAQGLLAAGEVACTGIHGANRLASNSLLEGLVYGARAGASAVKSNATAPEPPLELSAPVRTIPQHDEIRGRLRRLMWEKVGIIRCGESLTHALDELALWEFILTNTYATRRELELKNMLETALLITRGALKRKESVGAHYRTDSPKGEPGAFPCPAG
ncbi:MAG: FAD-binding protein [Nitrospirota bacterium]